MLTIKEITKLAEVRAEEIVHELVDKQQTIALEHGKVDFDIYPNKEQFQGFLDALRGENVVYLNVWKIIECAGYRINISLKNRNVSLTMRLDLGACEG